MSDLKSIYELLDMHKKNSKEKLDQNDDGNKIDKQAIYMRTIKILSYLGPIVLLIERKDWKED